MQNAGKGRSKEVGLVVGEVEDWVVGEEVGLVVGEVAD
jgi:hypothetical protein